MGPLKLLEHCGLGVNFVSQTLDVLMCDWHRVLIWSMKFRMVRGGRQKDLGQNGAKALKKSGHS